MSYRQREHVFGKRFYALSFLRKFAKILILKDNAVKKNAHVCRISTPDKGEVFDKAWEWTVYFRIGRLAMPRKR